MTVNVANKEADRLARRLAGMEGIGLSEAVIPAMPEAIERRRRVVCVKFCKFAERGGHGRLVMFNVT